MNLTTTGIGGLLAFLGFLNFVFSARLSRGSLKKISEAKGTSMVYGKVSPEETISSPISQTPCVYCDYKTFQRGAKFGKQVIGEGEPRGTAQCVFGSGVARSPFILEDETGKIRVEGRGLSYGKLPHEKTMHDDSAEYANQITEFKLRTNLGEGEERQYEEDLVCPGDSIYVFGNVDSNRVMQASLLSVKNPKKTVTGAGGIIKMFWLLIVGIILLIIGATQ
jgi:hypothetical protein